MKRESFWISFALIHPGIPEDGTSRVSLGKLRGPQFISK
jgi:hypothetical protein